MKQIKKLYVIVRNDISAGLQLSQSCHAAIQFQYEHQEISIEWHTNSNYIVILAAKDEQDLLRLLEKSRKLGLKSSVFVEPDFGNEVTAIAFEPSELTQKMCSNLPLALRPVDI